MHFWIERRGEWGRAGKHIMVTPVHRFQSVEAVRHHPHRPRHDLTSHGAHHASAAHVFEQQLAVQVQGPSLHTHHTAGRLKCGMWASFALVTVFMAGAKFYFNTQSTGLEVLVFCALLVVVLFAGCAVSLCEAVAHPPQPQVVTTAPATLMLNSTSSAGSSNSSSAPAPSVGPQTPSVRHTTIENININTMTSGHALSVAPPPPYHIAVLLPPPRPPGPPSPPPAYDKAVLRT